MFDYLIPCILIQKSDNKNKNISADEEIKESSDSESDSSADEEDSSNDEKNVSLKNSFSKNTSEANTQKGFTAHLRSRIKEKWPLENECVSYYMGKDQLYMKKVQSWFLFK